MSRFDLAALDFGSRGYTDASTIIRETFELARVAEGAGYSRYWLAEHHCGSCAWGNPVPLLASLAARTETIRVGVAGILLRFHDPLRIACDFALLERAFPNRIDLGLARGRPDLNAASLSTLQPGADPIAAREEHFASSVAQLLALLDPHKAVKTDPTCLPPTRGHSTPAIWLHGTGGFSRQIAQSSGTAFGFSLFHVANPNLAELRLYEENFTPSAFLTAPQAAIAVAGVCAKDRASAERAAQLAPNKSVIPTLVGDESECRDIIERIATETQTTNFIFLDISPTFDMRRESYERLAHACM